MPRCCGGSTCSCSIQAGSHIKIAGIGTATDPFVIIGDVDLDVVDNTTFNMSLTGLGTLLDPWIIGVQFAATAKLADFPDVSGIAPTNGQVLAWNAGANEWRPAAPTTAASGSVNHDTSLAGDGSAGTPLQVQEDPAGFLVTRAPGLGVSDAGINQMVRKFPTVAARAAASPAPTLDTLSLVDSAPGQIDYWTGSAWASAGGAFLLGATAGQEFYQLSGGYTGGRLTILMKKVITTTDAAGTFTVVDPTELAGKAGVMMVFTQLFAPETPIPISVMVEGAGGGLLGHAYRIDDGTVYALGTVGIMANVYVY